MTWDVGRTVWEDRRTLRDAGRAERNLPNSSNRPLEVRICDGTRGQWEQKGMAARI
jgi:hypothetical protein